MSTKAYSLWIYDRHCTLIFHHDWSLSALPSSSQLLVSGPDLLPGVSQCATQVGQGLPSASSSASHKLPLSEQGKLIYGLVFSLRNMLSKLSTALNAETASQFNTYSTSTYTFAHYQTASMYTFVLLTDPVQPPSRGLPGRPASESASNGSNGLLSGGGIAGTGGMSLPGVLRQIVAGPWLDWVVKNPAMTAGGLEWEKIEDEAKDDQDLDREDEEGEEGSGVRGKITRASRERGVESDGLRAGIEAVLAHNKLSTSFGAT